MNLQNLRESHPKLLSFMEENGYSKCYTGKLKREIKYILANAESKGWISYADVYKEYIGRLNSMSNLRLKRTYLGIIEHFDLRGLYPNGQRRHKIVGLSKYYQLNQEYRAVIDYYSAVEKARGKKDTTIYVESQNAACFMLALQQAGYDSLDRITEEAVLSFFVTPEGKLYRSCSYKKNIAAVFKACIPQEPETFNRILAFLPALREKRKNIQYLKPEEVALIKQVLANKESYISLRDRAIGTLALYTGLRCCDIAGLTMGSIDWNYDRLYINQQKTDVPLELPLTGTVGNAIYDYLRYERPEDELEYVFISNNRPYGRLRDRSLGNIAKKIMDVANIRQSPGDRRGFHIFRHHLATEMLGSNIPEPVILGVTGHTSPDSLETYLSADFKHLKECALSIEKYPMPKGGLSYV